MKVQYMPRKENAIADFLSRSISEQEVSPCKILNITVVGMPTRSPRDMNETQLKDENVKKIIESFESTQKTEDYAELNVNF